MDINQDSIEKMIQEQQVAIDFLRTDIERHKINIMRDEREIKTKEWMIQQWRVALGKLNQTEKSGCF